MSAPVIVPKPWGYETIFANFAEQNYCGKKLVVTRNHRISMQRHFKKHETFYVIRGEAYVEFGLPGTAEYRCTWYSTGDVCHIPPGQGHRLSAPNGDVHVIEASTFHSDDDIERHEAGGHVPHLATFCVGARQSADS